MPITRNTDPRTRHLHRGDAGQPNLSPEQIEWLNKNVDLEEELGLPLDSNRYPGYNESEPSSRMFVIKPDKNMADQAFRLQTANLQVGTPEFWRQVQLGNVFVYPMGQVEPSQLQIDVNPGKNPTVSLSKPLEEEQIPQRAMKAPNLWHRALAFLVPSYRERVRSWDNRQASHVRDSYVVYTVPRRDPKTLEAEKKRFEQERERRRNEAQARYEAEHNGAEKELQKSYQSYDLRQDNVERIFGIHPEARASYVDPKSLWCTKEKFQELKSFRDELDMGSLRNDGGPKFTDGDFAILAYWTAQKQEHMKRGAPERNGYNPRLGTILKSAGISDEDAEYIHNSQAIMMASTDLTDFDSPRLGDGTQTVTPTIQPARVETKEAFLAYKNGDKEHLAELVANAVTNAAREHTGFKAFSHQRTFSEPQQGQLALIGKLGELMEKDKDLANLAKEKYGMRQEDLKLVRGLTEYKKLSDARRRAQEELAGAEKKGTPLSAETRKKCLKDIVKADIAEKILYQDRLNHKPSKKTEELNKKLESVMGDMPRTDPVTKVAILDPNATKLNLMEYMNMTEFEIPKLHDERSKVASGLRADSPALDKAAEEIITADKLLDGSLSPGELLGKTKNAPYSVKAFGKAMEAVQKGGEKEVQKPQDEKNLEWDKNPVYQEEEKNLERNKTQVQPGVAPVLGGG